MASKEYGYVLTDIAESDIDETLEYISVVLSNPAAASDFADEFEKKNRESLHDFPGSFHFNTALVYYAEDIIRSL